jgi:glycosyltransferase involved in cell wall biosynthesis
MLGVLKGYGVSAPLAVIATGIEMRGMQDCRRQRFFAKNSIEPGRPTLVHVGRVAHEKNIGFLLAVLAEVRRTIPDVLLVIAGDGPARESLLQTTTRLGLQENVYFTGYQQRGPDLWDCFCAGDAFVFASSTETQGLVLLEAMALGVPVVSTAILGTKDILDAGRGALVADATTEDFTGKVIRILTDAPLRARLGAEARAYAAEWSAENQAVKLLEFYTAAVQ